MRKTLTVPAFMEVEPGSFMSIQNIKDDTKLTKKILGKLENKIKEKQKSLEAIREFLLDEQGN